MKLLLQDMKYAKKAVACALSGYVGLEYKAAGEWVPITRAHGKDGPFGLEDYPYYVCARFGNGRHIPLPLLVRLHERDYDRDGAKVQNFVIKICLVTRLLTKAQQDCAEYARQWNEEGGGL